VPSWSVDVFERSGGGARSVPPWPTSNVFQVPRPTAVSFSPLDGITASARFAPVAAMKKESIQTLKVHRAGSSFHAVEKILSPNMRYGWFTCWCGLRDSVYRLDASSGIT